jgi:nucleoid-associated protein EbfC
MFDMMNMMGKVKEMQAKMKEAQDKLVFLQASAEAGAGMVKATVNGHRQLVQLDIDPSLLTPADKEVLQDLVVAATNKALQAIEEEISTELQQATQGMMPNIPGLNLNDLMK